METKASRRAIFHPSGRVADKTKRISCGHWGSGKSPPMPIYNRCTVYRYEFELEFEGGRCGTSAGAQAAERSRERTPETVIYSLIMRTIRLLLLLTALLFVPPAFSKGGGGHRTSAYCPTCARTSKGQIARSSWAKHQFERSHPCPSTGRASGNCPGYVVDHIKPLKRGVGDSPGNMQWQTKAASKAKDKVE